MLENNLMTRDPDILGGIPIFVGTRVPVQTLLDYLEGGHPLKAFLDDFPTVQLTHAQGILRFFKQNLLVGTDESVA